MFKIFLPLFVGIAVYIGVFPEVVLKVPKLGFLLYHFASGAPIPPYMVNVQWEDDSKWLNSGDVVCSVAAKSGTTWAMATAHVLRTKGDDSFTQLLDVVPWADFVRYPGETLDTRIEYFKRAAKPYPFAVYKSHSTPSHIKMRDDVRYVVGCVTLST